VKYRRRSKLFRRRPGGKKGKLAFGASESPGRRLTLWKCLTPFSPSRGGEMEDGKFVKS
jgi:hypothetical protein